MSKFVVQKSRPSAVKLLAFQRPDPWVVCWYGKFQQNAKQKSIPLVEVWMAKMHPNGMFDRGFTPKTFGVTALGQLRIGSIWKNGVSASKIQFEQRTFKLCFDPGGWKFTSFSHESTSASVPINEFRPKLGDRQSLIEFEASGGEKLIVPSIEFFTRCFGRSQYVNRVLCTYPKSEWRDRLFVQDGRREVPGESWRIRLGRYVRTDDAVFISHLKYSKHTEKIAGAIYTQLDSQFRASSDGSLLKVGPWFTGSAELRVEGIAYGEDVFYGLRITGMSEPSGPHIQYERVENDPASGDDDYDEDPLESTGLVLRSQKPRRFDSAIPLTDEEAPDGGSEGAEVLDEPFEVIGDRRRCVAVKTPQSARGKTIYGQLVKASEYSSAELGSGGSNAVGPVDISTPIGIPTLGALLDFWNALVKASKVMPSIISDVGWLDEDCHRFEAEIGPPHLVRLPMSGDASSWAMIDTNIERSRGVLVGCITVADEDIYFFELERRVSDSLDGDTAEFKEESFSGLALRLPRSKKLRTEQLRKILAAIRVKKGIMKNVLERCDRDWVAVDYRRSNSSARDQAPLLTVVLALSRVGLAAAAAALKSSIQDGNLNPAA